MTDVAGKTAFITGGASGLGLATAKALAAKGAAVILADIDGAGAEQAADDLRREGADALGLQLDVTSEDSWAAAGERAREFGPVRILFSNAGVGGGSGPFEQYDTDVWRWNYAVNAHAHLYACRTFLGDMKASGEPSHLVITSSMVAIVPPPISVAYISSKYATLGVAMALRNELAEADIRYQFLFESLGEGVIYSATEGRAVEGARILAVNASCCRMLGYTNADLTGSVREKIFFDDDPLLAQALLQRERQGCFRGELRLRRADGAPLWVDLTSNLMTDESGRRQAVTIFRDATQRKELEQKAKHAERMEALGQLTGGVAHDFNNLLTVFLGGADELVKDSALGLYERELADTMKAAAERGHRLTGQLLAYARRQELRPRRIDVNRVIMDSAQLLRRLFTGSVGLRLDLERDLPCVKLDSGKFQTALLNLVANARDAMSAGGGDVRIVTAVLRLGESEQGLYAGLPGGRYVRVSVEDRGTGIPEDAMPRLFEPYFTTKPLGEGTGLGLPMVQGFMAQSGGDVRIESEWGKGTSVHLVLPALQNRSPGT